MKKYLYIALLILIFGFLVYFWQGIYLPKDSGAKGERIFIIQKGEGSKEISINLEKQGLIKSGLIFRIYVLTRGVAEKLQAGEYLISPSMALPKIVEKFVSGDVIKEKITIVEGWSAKDIASYLEERGLFKAGDFLKIVASSNDFSGDFNFLEDLPKNLSLEGYLFPDTYYFRKEEGGDGKEGIKNFVKLMLTNFDKKLTPALRTEIERQKKSIFEIVTTSSLIEKEVRTFDDKKIVSGILRKRLKTGIPLQIDATIVFITGKKTTEISIEETKIDSPYNTYKYKGLPLGPIANPGIESIIAALYPESSEYWYYLSAPDGKTIFSRTLEEHNIAKFKYLKPR